MSEVKEAPMVQPFNGSAERKPPQLIPQRIGLEEQLQQRWIVNAEEGTTKDDILDPGYWSFVSGQFEVFDRIEVRAETMEWMAELVVMDKGRNWARVHVLNTYDLVVVREAPKNSITHEVIWKGPQHKWVVVRKSDNNVLVNGLASRSAGDDWVASHLQAIGN